MKSFSALSSACHRVASVPRVWFIFWFFQFLLSAIVVAPLAALFIDNPGQNLLSSELQQYFDVEWGFEAYMYFHGAPLTSLLISAAVALLLALLGQVLLAGGAIALFTDNSASYSVQDYYRNCGRYFWRFFRLLLIALACYALLFAFSSALHKIAVKIWGEGMEARPLVYFGRARGVLVLALFLFLNAVFDFAKVRIVAENRRSACGAAVWALRFVLRHFFTIALLFATLTLCGVVLAAAYLGLDAIFPRTHLAAVLLLALIQQFALLMRIALRLTFWASETNLYNDLNPPYRPAEIAPVGLSSEVVP